MLQKEYLLRDILILQNVLSYSSTCKLVIAVTTTLHQNSVVTVKDSLLEMKQFAFVSDAAEREYKDFPKDIQYQFGTSLRAIQADKKPFLPVESLSSVGGGILELKINGSPAFRCVYIAKFLNTVFILHSFEKTTNGVDRQAMKTIEKRYKELKSELDNMKKQK